ncbi:MAG: hypothetical protein R3F02_11885 [Thiolinea sp.]
MGQHPSTTEPKLIDLRFALRRCIAKTALADIYWANDMHNTTHENPEKNVLLLLVTAPFAQQEGFARAWQQTLSRPAPPSSAYPTIISYGQDAGQYWIALDNINGELISERINELDERGLPLDSALYILENISHALSGVQAGPFGHLEPGAIQKTDDGYVILNAPLVKVLQQLPDSGRTPGNRLALHSAYISPSVAVGDTPVTEDDTFSAAALLYALLAGESPFGEQSSLTAVTHDFKPAYLKKLNKKTWEELSSALAFQRKPRAENPDKLLAALRKTNKHKILFPATVLAALGLIGFGIYHLSSKVGDFIQPPANQQQAIAPQPTLPATTDSLAEETVPAIPETTAETPDAAQEVTETAEVAEPAETPATEVVTTQAEPEQQAEPETNDSQISEIELVDEPEINEPEQEQTAARENPAPASEPETTTVTNTANTAAEDKTATEAAEKAQQLADLLEQAKAAVADNQTGDSSKIAGTLVLLRRINQLDENNEQAAELLNTMLENTLNNAEQFIDNNEFEQAQTRLSDSDKIIREFMVSGQLQRQVKLESKLTLSRQEQAQANELLAKARAALQADKLSKDDAEDDYALLHLNNLMFKQPDNQEGLALLEQVAGRRQQAAREALDRGELEQAGTYLAESERLIRRYRFTALENGQQALNDAYTNATQPVNPVAEIQGSEEPEILDPVTAIEANQLPTEALPVNEISIQEQVPVNNQVVTEGFIPEPAEQQNVRAEPIPELETAAPAVPIWESGTLEQGRNQPIQPQIPPRPVNIPATQPTVSYQPARPQPAPAPVNRPAPVPQPVQPNTVYTYQPDNQLVQPVNPQLINQFGNAARPIGGQNPAAPNRPVAIQQTPQPQPQLRQLPQPQVINEIPEMVPVEIIPELEEIPLSDIEEILPATN